MITAHFTGGDVPSFLIVTGIGLALVGTRRLVYRSDGPGRLSRARAMRMSAGGVLAIAAGVVAGVAHVSAR